MDNSSNKLVESINNKFIRDFIQILNSNEIIMTNCFKKILTILKKYPPAKHALKMIYGGLIQKTIIDHFNTIINIECIDLDKNHIIGSEYKNDCSLTINEKNHDFSIKASKSGGTITLINKYGKDNHNIENTYFIICHIEKRKLFIFKHTSIINKYIKDSGSSIQYKSGIFKFLEENYVNSYYTFPKNEILDKFEKNELPNINEEDIYQRLYDELK